jgi:hypothetical protein
MMGIMQDLKKNMTDIVSAEEQLLKKRNKHLKCEELRNIKEVVQHPRGPTSGDIAEETASVCCGRT